MSSSTFQTNPYDLHDLLKSCHRGGIQLPDFQRSWVWDEDRIKSLIASVSRPFPVGALMTLDTGGGIKGANRFDTFWGAGASGERIAGGMSASGRAMILLPKGAAARAQPIR